MRVAVLREEGEIAAIAPFYLRRLGPLSALVPFGWPDRLAEQIEPMEVSGKASDGTTWCYKGSFSCERPGRYGYALRVVPSHPDLLTFAEVGRVAWASAARVKRICD